MTSVGRCTCSISHAVVADLPVPVAPSRTTSVSPAFTFSASWVMAAGWSPAGSNSLTTVKRPWVGRMSVVVGTGRRYDAGVTERAGTAPWYPGDPRDDRATCPRDGAALACLVAGAVPDRGPAPPGGSPGRGRPPAPAADGCPTRPASRPDLRTTPSAAPLQRASSSRAGPGSFQRPVSHEPQV